ncbi:hypothetical protein N2152v2_004162 [Parachlorella kessleri]
MDGVVCSDPEACLPPNSLLEYCRPAWVEPPAPFYIDILHHDDHLLAIHKPAGLQVLPGGPFHQRCVLSLLRHYHAQHPGLFVGQPAPVHRLGRGTSGVLVCACSEEARRVLSTALEAHGSQLPVKAISQAAQQPRHKPGPAQTNALRGTSCSEVSQTSTIRAAVGQSELCQAEVPQLRIRKIYRALVQGLLVQDKGEVAVPIGKVDYPGVRRGLFAANPSSGKPALSHFQVVRRDPEKGQSVVEVEIFTGRPHQIRIHMAALGHPLVGDPLYGPGGGPRLEVGHPHTELARESCAGTVAAAPVGTGDAAAVLGGASVAAEGAAGTLEPPLSVEAAGVGGGERGWGAAAVPGDCGYLLHCMTMEFRHPITAERLRVHSPPPPELA